MVAGTHGILPMASACSMAGKSSDQIEAAVITPAANPKKILLKLRLKFFRTKKTQAAPAVVIKKMNSRPNVVSK